jgi:hypothetical protein
VKRWQKTVPEVFAVFPFLQTSGPVSIGDFVVRSTNDKSGLNAEEANHLATIAGSLFLKDDLRIQSASYAVTPYLDLGNPLSECEDLKRISIDVDVAVTVRNGFLGEGSK